MAMPAGNPAWRVKRLLLGVSAFNTVSRPHVLLAVYALACLFPYRNRFGQQPSAPAGRRSTHGATSRLAGRLNWLKLYKVLKKSGLR
jgi:hypothetical protein